MPISGLVLTSRSDAHSLRSALAADPRITPGEPQGRCLPVVTEVDSLEEAEALTRALMAREDVLFVDVVSVSLEGEGEVA